MWEIIRLFTVVGLAIVLAALPLQTLVVARVLPVQPDLAAFLISYLISILFFVGGRLLRR